MHTYVDCVYMTMYKKCICLEFQEVLNSKDVKSVIEKHAKILTETGGEMNENSLTQSLCIALAGPLAEIVVHKTISEGM